MKSLNYKITKLLNINDNHLQFHNLVIKLLSNYFGRTR